MKTAQTRPKTANIAPASVLSRTQCNTVQHTAICRHLRIIWGYLRHSDCNTLQLLQHVQHSATYCNKLQYTAIHCNTLQYTAIHCNTPPFADIIGSFAGIYDILIDVEVVTCATHCNVLQHTATHCNTLQHTAPQCISEVIYGILMDVEVKTFDESCHTYE
jgi:hypothetical protein